MNSLQIARARAEHHDQVKSKDNCWVGGICKHCQTQPVQFHFKQSSVNGIISSPKQQHGDVSDDQINFCTRECLTKPHQGHHCPSVSVQVMTLALAKEKRGWIATPTKSKTSMCSPTHHIYQNTERNKTSTHEWLLAIFLKYLRAIQWWWCDDGDGSGDEVEEVCDGKGRQGREGSQVKIMRRRSRCNIINATWANSWNARNSCYIQTNTPIEVPGKCHNVYFGAYNKALMLQCNATILTCQSPPLDVARAFFSTGLDHMNICLFSILRKLYLGLG